MKNRVLGGADLKVFLNHCNCRSVFTSGLARAVVPSPEAEKGVVSMKMPIKFDASLKEK